MKICAPHLCLLACVVLATVFSAPRTAVGSQDPRALAFGWLVEHADAVVVATVTADRSTKTKGLHEFTLVVDDAIRGPLERDATAKVLVQDHGEGVSYTLQHKHLAFLRALPATEDEPHRWVLVSGAFGMRPVPASGPEARFPGICRTIAETLEDADAYRTLLVGLIEDGDPGIAWSAATDLVRHAEMHDALTLDERQRIVAAFERQPIGKATKKALALAAAATRDAAATPALVRSLLLPRAREIRIEIGVALRRLESPDTVGLLAQALESAEPQQTVNLVNALGTAAPASAAAAAVAHGHVLSVDPAVRVEAAHALGLIWRKLHRANPQGRLSGWEELLTALDQPRTKNEQLAAVWALAQCDEQQVYEALQELATSDERPLVRQAAKRYLANPRLSLVLR